MRTYTIRNDFHGSSVNVRCEGVSHYPGECTIYLSKSQIKRVNRALCGMSDCQCGSIRGQQETNDGKRLIVDTSALYAN